MSSVDPPDHVFDRGLLDGDVAHRDAFRHLGEEFGRRQPIAPKPQPLPGPFDSYDIHSLHRKGWPRLDKVHDEGAFAAVARLDRCDGPVLDHPSVVDDEQTVAETLDVDE